MFAIRSKLLKARVVKLPQTKTCTSPSICIRSAACAQSVTCSHADMSSSKSEKSKTAKRGAKDASSSNTPTAPAPKGQRANLLGTRPPKEGEDAQGTGAATGDKKDDRTRIVVKNLPATLTEEKLREMFAAQGEVTDCKLMRTKCDCHARCLSSDSRACFPSL